MAPGGARIRRREIEREYIRAALERNHGNRTLTAPQLQIGPATLRKLKEYADDHWALVFLAEFAGAPSNSPGAV